MPFVSASLILLALGQSASAELIAAERQRLEACIERIETDPSGAHEDGLAWLNEGGRPPARQCTALALIALNAPADGAARLEALANAPDAGSLEQRAIYLMQSGNAWLLAGAYEAAITTFTNAIKLVPNEADLLKDRALAYMALRRWVQARMDLDEVLGLRPDDGEAYRLRAQISLEEQKLEVAMRDIRSAMAAEPDNIDTLVLRGRIREAMRLEREP